MTNSQSANEILTQLDKMSSEFNSHAQALSAAAQALREEQQKNLELQKQLHALQNASALKKLKGKSFTLLIDGSGSMSGKPLELAFDGIANFSRETGAKVTSVIWGDQWAAPVTIENAESLNNFLKKGWGCGTAFAPAIDYMGTAKEKHFVVVGDGDLYDPTASLLKAPAFLTTHPKATIDFVMLEVNYRANSMGAFVSQLQQQFPAQVTFRLVTDKETFSAALTDIALQRVSKPKKNADPQPPKQP